VSCSRHVCPTYLSSFDVRRRAIEAFFSYYVLDSLEQSGQIKKTREGFIIFNRPEEFKTYSTWAEDSIGWAGIINDTSTASMEDFKFKSGKPQSRWAVKKKPAEDLFKSYPQTSVLTGAQKIGILSKIFKKRPQNFNRYVKAKLNWAKPQTDSTAQDTATIMDATVEDLKFQIKKEPKKILVSSEQLFYDIHLKPLLPNFDSLIYSDTAKVEMDSAQVEKPRRWWQFWKKKKKVISDFQVEEEDEEEEVIVEGEDFAAPDPPEGKRSSERDKKNKKGKRKEEEEETEEQLPQETDEETDEELPAKKKKKDKKPKKPKKGKKSETEEPEEPEETGE
jgi:hypothetical protein